MATNEESSAKQIEEARTAVTASLSSIGSSITADIQTRANDLHANAAAIEKQEKELAKQTAALAKQSAQYQKLLDKSTKSLNEIGDVQNWAEMIERDLLVAEETLRLAEGREERESASGTNGWA
jgi:hypothetical protein